MKVLIVDDEILVRKGITMGIDWSKLGFEEVREASNGQQALEIIKEIQPDLVLTDIKMPKINGLQLINEIKKSYPGTTVIVLSCINDGEYIRQAMQFGGAIDYIPKLSLSTEELIKVIERAKKNVHTNQTHKKVQLEHEKYITNNLFTKERESQLREFLEVYQYEQAVEVVKDIFQDTYKYGISKECFVEWHDILSVLTSFVKNRGGNINEIKILNQIPYQFIDESKNIFEMEERFCILIEEASTYIRDYKYNVYGKEITQAIEYMHQNYQQSIKLSDVAMTIGISEAYLSTSFKKQTGINFIDYLNKIRIEKAKKLLRSEKLPVYQVAEFVGYNNESYFSRIFKHYEGMSPKQYQKIYYKKRLK